MSLRTATCLACFVEIDRKQDYAQIIVRERRYLQNETIPMIFKGYSFHLECFKVLAGISYRDAIDQYDILIEKDWIEFTGQNYVPTCVW